MSTITIQAVYQDGVLKPVTSLDLPENARVQITLTSVPEHATRAAGSTPFGALKGIWSHAAFSPSMELALQKLRARSVEKLERLAREL